MNCPAEIHNLCLWRPQVLEMKRLNMTMRPFVQWKINICPIVVKQISKCILNAMNISLFQAYFTEMYFDINPSVSHKTESYCEYRIICSRRSHSQVPQWRQVNIVAAIDIRQWPIKWTLFNPSPPSAAYMRQWMMLTLVQIMACRLFGAKTLSKPLLGYCQLDT